MKNAKQKQKKEMQNIENAKIKTAMLGAYTTKSKKNNIVTGRPSAALTTGIL